MDFTMPPNSFISKTIPTVTIDAANGVVVNDARREDMPWRALCVRTHEPELRVVVVVVIIIIDHHRSSSAGGHITLTRNRKERLLGNCKE